MTAMDYQAIFVAVCIVTHVLLGFCFEAKIKSGWLVVLGSVIAVLLFQLFAYAALGYLDAFVRIAVLVQAPIALAIGALVLWSMRKLRARHRG